MIMYIQFWYGLAKTCFTNLYEESTVMATCFHVDCLTMQVEPTVLVWFTVCVSAANVAEHVYLYINRTLLTGMNSNIHVVAV